MKNICLICLIMLVMPLFGEGGMVLEESDWLHLSVPGAVYLSGVNFLVVCGVDDQQAEWMVLGAGCLAVIGCEYYGGCQTKEDVELGLTSLAVGWVVNRGVRAVFGKRRK